VRILLGNGDGSFGGPITLDLPNLYLTGLGTADLTGDGRSDLIIEGVSNLGYFVQPAGGTKLEVILGKGDGTFAAPQEVFATNSNVPVLGDFAASDLDADGREDLVLRVGGSHRILSVLLGNGDGTFVVPAGRAFFPGVVASGDFKGNGRTSLVVGGLSITGSSTSGDVQVYPGNGDGTFGAPIITETGLEEVDALAVADFNGDGRTDLAVEGTGPDGNWAVAILLGNGNGTFGPPEFVQTGLTGTGVQLGYELVAGDFNGDGRADLALEEFLPSGSSAVVILPGNGSGTFGPPQLINTGLTVGGIAAVDLQGDGRTELVCLWYSLTDPSPHEQLTLLRTSGGDGSFAPLELMDTGLVYYFSGPEGICTDGRGDLAVVGSRSAGRGPQEDTVSILLNNGNGTFASTQLLDTGYTGAANMVLTDLDGDGQPDLAVTGFGPNGYTMEIFLTRGSEGLALSQTIDLSGPIFFGGFAAADFKGAGRPDLLVVDETNAAVQLFFNGGDGMLLPAITLFQVPDVIPLTGGPTLSALLPTLTSFVFEQSPTPITAVPSSGAPVGSALDKAPVFVSSGTASSPSAAAELSTAGGDPDLTVGPDVQAHLAATEELSVNLLREDMLGAGAPLSSSDLATQVLFGASLRANLRPQKGSSLAPVATFLPETPSDEPVAPGGPPPSAETELNREMIGLRARSRRSPHNAPQRKRQADPVPGGSPPGAGQTRAVPSAMSQPAAELAIDAVMLAPEGTGVAPTRLQWSWLALVMLPLRMGAYWSDRTGTHCVPLSWSLSTRRQRR
jgi:hypothetical protein